MSTEHNHDEFDSLFTGAKLVGLTTSERQAHRAALVQLTEQKPIGRNSLWSFVFRPIPAIALSVIVLMIFSSSVAFAAERALPGDQLYSLKVNIIEPTQLALTVSLEGKVNRRTEILEERLREAEALVANGKLTSDLRGSIERRVSASAEILKQEIEKLDDSGKHEEAANAQASVEGSLEAHTRVLREKKHDDDTPEVDDLLERAEKNQEEAREQRSKSEERLQKQGGPAVEEAARGRRKSAENKVREVQRYINERRDKRQAAQLDKAQVRLDEARQTLAKGHAAYDGQHFQDAFQLFQTALRQAEEAKRLAGRAQRVRGKSTTNQNVNRSSENRNENSNDDDRHEGSTGSNVNAEKPEDPDDHVNENRNSDHL